MFCASTQHSCNNVCFDRTSIQACGTSCTPCQPLANATATCDGTACGFKCNSATQHACNGACVDNSSVQSCGVTSCQACPQVTGATATCDGTKCGYTCTGATAKDCGGGVCVANTQCCTNADCPTNAGGQTGTCDTGTHACNYNCPSTGNTKSCTVGSTTTCIAPTGCCVDSDCPGSCMMCNSSHSCVPAAGQQDPNGRCAGTCDNTGACVSKKGQLCNTTTAGCISGTTCSKDGYCCDSACSGPCQACDFQGQQGTCLPLPPNSTTPHTGHPSCVGAGTSCGGSCDGNGNCSYPSGACGSGSCSGSGYVPAGSCSGGSCVYQTAQVCAGNLTCSANACKSSCTADADCIAGYFCDAGTCYQGAIGITAGDGHACALLADGTLRCWGENDHGELGLGTFTTTGFDGVARPTAVGLPKTATGVTAQYEGTCALLADGAVYCWGLNNDGDLGIGTFTTTGNDSVATPTKVTGLGGSATTVSGGHAHACALVGSAAWCWGENYNGELGNGTFQTAAPVGSDTAIQVKGLNSVSQVSAGGDFTCAVSASSIYCWGWNLYGQLGNSTYSDSASPQLVSAAWTGTVLSVIAGAGKDACALISGGSVYCWGDNTFGEIGAGFFNTDAPYGVDNPWAVTGAVSAVTAIALGGGHACAINGDGSVSCWGSNSAGQLGNGSILSTSPYGTDTAGLVSGLPHPATAIAAGGDFTCALLSNGAVWCWGGNNYGQLGNGNESTSAIPVQVSGW